MATEGLSRIWFRLQISGRLPGNGEQWDELPIIPEEIREMWNNRGTTTDCLFHKLLSKVIFFLEVLHQGQLVRFYTHNRQTRILDVENPARGNLFPT